MSGEEKKEFCYRCRGEGEVGGCKDCGTDKVKEIVEIETEEIDRLIIPKWYVKREWNKDIVIRDNPKYRHDPKFNRLVEQMDRAHQTFKEGRNVGISGIFVAPRKFSKMTWAYSCLQLAQANGLKTVPIMDTQQIKRFITINEQRPLAVKDEDFGCSYEEFIMADIVIMTVTKSYYYRDASQVIDLVLDMRSRYGKPTIVISRFNMKEITEFDRKGLFNSLIDVEGRENGMRYPAIIEFSESAFY